MKKYHFKRFIQKIDEALLPFLKKISNRNGNLIILGFHNLCREISDLSREILFPPNCLSLSKFKRCINYFLKNKYTFISPIEILEGLDPTKNFAMITFDDGYHNVMLSLPVLKKHNIPAVFFISYNHILEQKCFWWDVLYRERKKQGIRDEKIIEEMNECLLEKTNIIEKKMKKKFGKNIFTPVSNLDRPLTVEELKYLSKKDFMCIGNHTMNHAILPNYSIKKKKEQISDTQTSINKLIYKTPQVIAYPNGKYSNEIIELCKRCNLKMGITSDYRKNKVCKLNNNDKMLKLGRFIIENHEKIKNRCQIFELDFSIMGFLQRFIRFFQLHD